MTVQLIACSQLRLATDGARGRGKTGENMEVECSRSRNSAPMQPAVAHPQVSGRSRNCINRAAQYKAWAPISQRYIAGSKQCVMLISSCITGQHGFRIVREALSSDCTINVHDQVGCLLQRVRLNRDRIIQILRAGKEAARICNQQLNPFVAIILRPSDPSSNRHC